MSDNFIERMAQKLHELALANNGNSRGPADMMEDARAIVAEMRDPSSAMLEEGRRNDLPMSADAIWERMIDAALGE